MRKTFHLRFVPFGTSFERAEHALRCAAGEPGMSFLCDNEIVVDVSGCCFGYKAPGDPEPEKAPIFDHHFLRPDNYPSASAAVLHHATDIVKLLGIYDELWIVTHREPDFDALCAVFLVKSLLGETTADPQEQPPSRLDPAALSSFGLGGDVSGTDVAAVGKINWFDPDARPSDPGGWAVLLAAYASCVDGGRRLHADRRRRLHSVLYAGIVRRRFSSQDGMERLFSEARRAMIAKQLNPIYDALFDDNSEFAPELELLRNEARVYDRDIARARKSIVSLQVGHHFEDWYSALQKVPLMTNLGERNPAHRSVLQAEQIREADGVYIHDPECLLFKEWAREDFENSSMGRGFLFTAVAYTRNQIAHGLGNAEYFFALDPEKARGAHLYNLWAALQVAEVAALQQTGVPSPFPAVVRRGFEGRAGNLAPYFADPWFDGGNYRATIIVSPIVEPSYRNKCPI